MTLRHNYNHRVQSESIENCKSSERGEKIPYVERNKIRMVADFLLETMQAGDGGAIHSKCRKTNGQPRILCPVKYNFQK